MISAVSTKVRQDKTGTGRMATVGKEITTQSIPNPKAELIPKIDQQISEFRADKQKKEYKRNLRENLESEYKSKAGFLDEVEMMMGLLSSYTPSFIVWLLFLLFLSLWNCS